MVGLLNGADQKWSATYWLIVLVKGGVTDGKGRGLKEISG